MVAPDLFDNERIGLRLEPVVDRENTEVVGKCNLVIPMEIKRYERFRYTTNLSTLNLIFQNHTFRSNNLTYARLNDRMECGEMELNRWLHVVILHVSHTMSMKLFRFG